LVSTELVVPDYSSRIYQLGEKGKNFAQNLKDLLAEHHPDGVEVYSSTLPRAIQTAEVSSSLISSLLPPFPPLLTFDQFEQKIDHL